LLRWWSVVSAHFSAQVFIVVHVAADFYDLRVIGRLIKLTAGLSFSLIIVGACGSRDKLSSLFLSRHFSAVS
jgi:hypothetical protein